MKGLKIYVGNLNYTTTEEQLKAAFSQYGSVVSVAIINDRNTGRSRGFGFVEMENDDEARTAIQELNGKEVWGRNLTVNEARPRVERRPSY